MEEEKEGNRRKKDSSEYPAFISSFVCLSTIYWPLILTQTQRWTPGICIKTDEISAVMELVFWHFQGKHT